MRMNLRFYIICVAAVLAFLVVPAVADNRTSTVHGGVYGWDSFEPLENAVVDVNSTPSQSMLAKSGIYSFELEPGNYSITARYYQNDTLTYSGTETITIKDGGGSYVLDLLLLPVYSDVLMDSSDANASSKNLSFSGKSTTTVANVNNTKAADSSNIIEHKGFFSSSIIYFITAVMLFLLLAGGYQLSRKHKNNEKNALQENKTGQTTGGFPEFQNMPETPVKTHDKSTGSGVKQDFQVTTNDSASRTGPIIISESRSEFETTVIDLETKSGADTLPIKPIIGPESKLSTSEQIIESESRVSENRAFVENKENCIEGYPIQETEISEAESEEKNETRLTEEPADNSEIEFSVPKKKLPLPSDLQEIMDIIRGHGGRITQKDLRNRLKYSEGKVSLMLADLERRDLIEKFKRGRGNIVILKDEES